MTTDVLLVGGGLANSLIALRLRALRPALRLLLLEQGPALGGNHTWSFHRTDLTDEQRAWIAPLLAHEWDGHEVRFPAYRRQLSGGYCSITSDRLHRVVSEVLGVSARTSVPVREVTGEGVRLPDGSFLPAGMVIDGRGFQAGSPFELRYQKFLGQVVELREPHGLAAPILMDATVAQRDGYRFVYVLPLDGRRLLIEDTYYSDSAQLAPAELRTSIRDYADANGWRIAAVEREETGVLPVVLDGDIRAFWASAGSDVPRVGLRAMLCHHTTGFSLPQAVRLAEEIAAGGSLQGRVVAARVRARALAHWREQRLFRLLNRMLFDAARPDQRYRVLEHFYRLPEATIARFYAGRLRPGDVLRLVTGTPPVPIRRAMRALLAGAGAAQAARRLAHGGSK